MIKLINLVINKLKTKEMEATTTEPEPTGLAQCLVSTTHIEAHDGHDDVLDSHSPDTNRFESDIHQSELDEFQANDVDVFVEEDQ